MKAKQTLRVLCIMLITLAISLFVGNAMASDYPDEVMLDSMADLFEGVMFDHELHADLGEDCAVCHHHTTGTGAVGERCISCHSNSEETAEVACSACHPPDPFSAANINREALDIYQYHVDRPGLKAAYHRGCVACHQAMGAPEGCTDCHARTEEGDAFYHVDAEPSSTADAGH